LNKERILNELIGFFLLIVSLTYRLGRSPQKYSSIQQGSTLILRLRIT